MKKKDLKDVPHSILLCKACGAEYSATPGDYWNLKPDDPLDCLCGNSLVQVKRVITYRKM